jgi:eukaryotic-like serine/threonine-protein kinase
VAVPAHGEQARPGRVGRYQLVRRIPGGGMTEVYLARVADALGPERPLVIKVLPEDEGRGRDAEVRFLEESKIALSLAHGNVVTTFETGRAEDGRLFLVMEYVHGASLREILEAGPLPPPLALFIAREVARALRYTHTFVDIEGRAAPMVHLDVTPENVLVSRAGHVKLTDFGIARAVGEARGGPVFGKAAYTAPEVLGGAAGGPEADLWSLGCVLHELLAGEAPHRGADREETLARVRSAEPPPPPSSCVDLPEAIAADVDGLVTELLKPDPGARLEDAARVERVLTAALNRVEPLPTEADLAALMTERFPAAGAGDRDRLRAELEAAGRALSGAEDTAALLAEGTVPLDPGTGDAAEAAPQAEARRPGRKAFSALVIGLALLAPLLFLDHRLGLGLLFGAGEAEAPAGAGAEVVLPASVEAEPGAQATGEPPGALAAETPSEPEAGTPGDLPAEAPIEATAGTTPEATAARVPAVEPSPGEAEAPVAAHARMPVAPARPEPPPRGEAPNEVASADAPEAEAGRARDEAAPARDDAAPGRDEAAEPPAGREPAVAHEPAVLQINAFPYARVLLDDDTVLGTTPLRDVSLPAGRTRLRFSNPELGLEREVVVDLEPGESRVLGVRLDR